MQGLTEHTSELFEKICNLDIFKDYYFVGGSAISTQINHRLSEDLDFCKWKKAKREKVTVDIGTIERELKKFGLEKTEILGFDQVDLHFKNKVKVSFFADNERYAPNISPVTIKGNINAIDLKSAGIMKLELMLRRSKFRDYYDIYSILKEGVDIKNMVLDTCKYSLHRLSQKNILSFISNGNNYEIDKGFSNLNAKYIVNENDIEKFVINSINNSYEKKNVNQNLSQMKTFEDYIQDIDLVRFIEDYGYSLNEKGSKLKSNGEYLYAELKNESNGDTLLVMRHRNKPHNWIYKNRHNDTDKGNVINFLRERENNDYKRINEILQKYTNTPSNENYVKQAPKVVKIENEIKPEAYWNAIIKDNKDFYAYMADRGIDEKILEHKFFKGSIVSDKYNNAIFPLYNSEDKITGLDSKNYETVTYLGMNTYEHSVKSGSMWESAYDKNRPIDYISIGEAPIDVISKWALDGKPKYDNPLFLATTGEFSNETLENLNKKLESNPNAHLDTAFDNDVTGEKFNVYLLGNVKLKNADDAIKIFYGLSDNYKTINIKSEVYDRDNAEEKAEILMDNIKSTFGEEVKLSYTLTQGKEFAGIKFELPYNKNNLSIVQSFIMKSRNIDEDSITISKPVTKDFNNDLMLKLGLDKNKLIKNDENYYKNMVAVLKSKKNKLNPDKIQDRKNIDVIDKKLNFIHKRFEQLNNRIIEGQKKVNINHVKKNLKNNFNITL